MSEPLGSGELAGRVAIVTGAGTGIGLGIASCFAAEGAIVYITGRRAELLEEAVAGIVEQCDGIARAVQGDVRNEADVASLFERVQHDEGRLDILVNNAAVAGAVGNIWDLSVEDFREALDINLTGPWLCTRAAARMMMPARSGKIINIGSISGKRPLVTRTPYVTTKLGLVGMTKTVALELGEYNINVNNISPGAVDTPRLAHLAETRGRAVDEMIAATAGTAALNRISVPEDVANLALFLATERSRNMTGLDITVDAGTCFI